MRALLLRKMVGDKNEEIRKAAKVDFSRLPPCRMSLIPHIKRANFRACQWKRSHEKMPSLPKLDDHGWTKDLGTNSFEPIWSEGPILPKRLIDIVPEIIENQQLESVDEENEFVDEECEYSSGDSDNDS